MLDKNGRPIEEFDVLKVFHFIGPRRKKFYMYKVALHWNGKLYASHIGSNPLTPDYPLWNHPESRLNCTEIVQSKNWEKLDMPKKKDSQS